MSDELSQANNRGFELGRRHAALADVIGQAALWASSFGVSTAEVLPDGSVFMTYPLSQHADYLVELWRLLGGACVNLASSFEGRMSAQDVSVTPLSHEAAIQSPTYVIGADFVHVLQSRSAHRSTLQDLWRNEVTNAAMYLSVCGIRTDGLERYAAISQALFDDASTVVREAYAHSVAVTYGRIWARASQANEGRVLMAWMKALADGGFSFEECILELRDLKVASPEAVSSCLNSKSAWLHEEE